MSDEKHTEESQQNSVTKTVKEWTKHLETERQKLYALIPFEQKNEKELQGELLLMINRQDEEKAQLCKYQPKHKKAVGFTTLGFSMLTFYFLFDVGFQKKGVSYQITKKMFGSKILKSGMGT